MKKKKEVTINDLIEAMSSFVRRHGDAPAYQWSLEQSSQNRIVPITKATVLDEDDEIIFEGTGLDKCPRLLLS